MRVIWPRIWASSPAGPQYNPASLCPSPPFPEPWHVKEIPSSTPHFRLPTCYECLWAHNMHPEDGGGTPQHGGPQRAMIFAFFFFFALVPHPPSIGQLRSAWRGLAGTEAAFRGLNSERCQPSHSTVPNLLRPRSG